MRYLLAVYFEENAFAGMSQDDMVRLDQESLANDDELRRTGNLVAAEALQSPRTAVTVAVRDGRMSATEGPFAETAEHLGGFLLVDARDLNDAVRIAERTPVARIGRIEVRPVLDFATQPESPADVPVAGAA
jgi:hypothetical protein